MTATGDLDHRVTLQYPTISRDTAGSVTTTWNDAATVWTKKTTHRSDEAVQAMATTGTATHNYRIRWRSDVRANWRVKDGVKYLAIIGPPVEVGRREFLDITAREAA